MKEREALKKAIRVITVDGPNGGPHNEAERQLLALASLTNPNKWGPLSVAAQHQLMKVNNALAAMSHDQACQFGALRVAADNFFGEDFTAEAKEVS